MSGLFDFLKSAWRLSRERGSEASFQSDRMNYILPHLWRHKGKIIAGLGLMLVVSLIVLPVPYLTKLLIDDVFPRKDLRMLHILVLVMLALYVGKLFASFAMNYLFSALNQDVQVHIRQDVFHKLLCLPLAFYAEKQTGYLLARLQEVQGLSAFFSSSLIGLAVSILEFVFSLVILFYLSWQLTCIALVILPAYFVVLKILSKGVKTSSRNYMEVNAQLSKNVQESLAGINLVKTFGAEERQTGLIQKNLDHYFRTGMVQSILLSLSSEFVVLIGAVGTCAILWFSGIKIMNDQFTVGSYVAFAAYVIRLYVPTQRFASMGITLQPALAALSRVSELFAIVSEEDRTERSVRVPRLRGEVRLEHVSFGYDSETPVIRDVTMHIRAGETIAIVGPSGAGKSTLIALLLQLYVPWSGTILLDDIDASTIELRCLRERIGVVSQDVFLFNDTVRNNIRFGRPEADEEEVLKASQLACAHGFIVDLPEGYDTIVGERGVRLSAGQKQRIAIARAVLCDPDVLIFDEATATLDSLSEKAIREFIFETCREKTVVIIAHKFSTMASVDRVFVFDRGRVVQEGRPKMLGEVDGLYKRLYDTQKSAMM